MPKEKTGQPVSSIPQQPQAIERHALARGKFSAWAHPNKRRWIWLGIIRRRFPFGNASSTLPIYPRPVAREMLHLQGCCNNRPGKNLGRFSHFRSRSHCNSPKRQARRSGYSWGSCPVVDLRGRPLSRHAGSFPIHPFDQQQFGFPPAAFDLPRAQANQLGHFFLG